MRDCPVDSPWRAGGETPGRAAEPFRRRVPVKRLCWSTQRPPQSVTAADTRRGLSHPGSGQHRPHPPPAPSPGPAASGRAALPVAPRPRRGSWGPRRSSQGPRWPQMAPGAGMGADSHTGPQALRAGDVVQRCAWATHLQVQVLMVSPGSVSPGDLRPRSPPGLAAGPGSPPGRRTCWPAAKLTVPGQAAQGAEDADGAGWPGTQGPGGAGSATEHLSRPVFLGAGTMVFHLCPGSQRGVSTQWTDGWTEGRGPVSLA